MADGGWVDLQQDVTKAELRLAAAVFAHTQEGIVVTDAECRVVTINPAYSAITGYSLKDLAGQNLRIVQSGRQCPAFYRKMWQAIAREGHWQGEIWNQRKNGEIYPALLTISAVRDEKGIIVNYVGTSTDMTRLKKSEVQLDHLAHHDALTGLPNRLLLASRMRQAIARAKRNHQAGAVLFLDLDYFKAINDAYGHAFGDELLVLVARRLKSRLRETDTVARIGGDEFVILLENISAPSAAKVAQELISKLSQPFTLSSKEAVCIGTTIGISVFRQDATPADELIKQADAALYRAKNAGRGAYQFYSAGTE